MKLGPILMVGLVVGDLDIAEAESVQEIVDVLSFLLGRVSNVEPHLGAMLR